MAKILIVDDHASIREVVRFALEKEGHQCVEAVNGENALKLFKNEKFECMILDIVMPELDGISVCKQIRAASNMPIIFLSSRDEELDRILGLELGGDDYVTKPFSPRELAARVKVVLRRVNQPQKEEGKNSLVFKNVKLDAANFLVSVENQAIDLTATEFEILHAIFKSPQRVFERDTLIRVALGDDVHVTDRTIDTHVKRIRSKFTKTNIDPIETVHGIGYRLSRTLI